MRELVIVRHAIAEERDPRRWAQDSARPLSPRGKRRFRPAARGLGRLIRVDVVLTSPCVRAVQTAELLRRTADWPAAERLPALRPGRPAAQLLALLARRREHCVAIVGHEPQLGELLALAVGGPGQAPLGLRKGGAASVRFRNRPAAGRGELRWWAAPRLLRRLSRRGSE